MQFNYKRLKAERIAQGMSQQELADKLNKSRSWLAKRENGLVNTGVDEFSEIMSALNIEDISIFFTKNVPEKQQIGEFRLKTFSDLSH